MSRVIDYAWGRPAVASLKTAGAVAVCRYLAWDNSSTHGKLLSRAEADGLRAGGIDVVSNWENAGNWAEYGGGQTTGRSHAAEANRQHIACGGPPDRPIFFSTDWGATSTQLGAIADYYRGVASVIGLARTGAYGSYAVIKYLFDQGVITYGWQTYAWSSFRDDPSGQIYIHWDRRAQLRQIQNGVAIGGVDCDLDDSMTDDFGQWSLNSQESNVLSGSDLGRLINADAWAYATANLLPSVNVAYADNPDAMGVASVPITAAIRDIRSQTAAMAADIAAVKTATAAAQATIAALAAVVNAGGGNVDTAAILAHIDAASGVTSATVAALHQEIADLQSRLARAFAA